MKFGVVIFPGSNCDQDMIYVLETIMGREVVPLWHKEADLKGVDGVFLPGGFSYGDYLRSGAIARYSSIMDEVVRFARKGGFVFGVCNGFQILCEAGLLPGALLHNTNQKFICKNQYILPINPVSRLTEKTERGEAMKIPIAHGEGRFYAPQEEIDKLYDNKQVIFKYCDKKGFPDPEANPNGSVDNIAGICNKEMNVYGMMPHPERASDPELGNEDGRSIFESIIASFA